MEQWNGLDWNGGMEWNGMMEWRIIHGSSLNRIANNILVILVQGRMHKEEVCSIFMKGLVAYISGLSHKTRIRGVADPSGKRGTV